MALASLSLHQQLSISSSSAFASSSTSYTPHFQTPQLFTIPKTPPNRRRTFSISSSSTPTPDPTPIFLPFLQNPARTRLSKREPSVNTGITDEIINPRNAETVSEVKGVVEEVLKIARALPDNITIGEALERYDFGGRLGEEGCVEVLRVFAEEGNVMGCLHFFEWMRLKEASLVSPKACSVLFPALGRAMKGDELVVVFKNLPFKLNKLTMDVRVYNAAISGLLFCARYDDAWQVYELMEASDIQPDHITCSLMITIMNKRGDSAGEAWDFFDKMNDKGVEWSLESVTALIESFCNEGLKKQALIIQSELEKRGIPSNAVIYNTIMESYVQSNHVEEAEGLFGEMKVKHIAPNADTYNILMDAYSRRMQPEIVEKLLQEMEDNGLEPNERSYMCLISAYGKQKKMSEMAEEAFLRMKKSGIKPSSESYTSLIHAYSVNSLHEKAYTEFDNMLKDGVGPTTETYTSLLDAIRRAGDTEMLMRIWKLMTGQNIKVTRDIFNILVDGFAKRGLYDEARDVISVFGILGFGPTVMTYNMLMNAYAKGRQESKMPQLLKEMAALNLKPDSITYSTMIYAYVRARDFKRAFFYHKQMVKSGQVPEARAYQKLRAVLDVKTKIKSRSEKSALMGIMKSSMALLKGKKKGKKDEFWKNRKKKLRINGGSAQPER